MSDEGSRLIASLSLSPHQEGGYFKSTYEANINLPLSVLPRSFLVARPVSTAIYFLLCSGQVSRLHRIPSDEVWHFYKGDPLVVFQIQLNPNANDTTRFTIRQTVLGTDIEAGQVPQHVVPAGVWFGAYLLSDFPLACPMSPALLVSLSSTRDSSSSPARLQHYSLVGCTVSPGFRFDDFELSGPAQRHEWKSLIEQPQFTALFDKLCPRDASGDRGKPLRSSL